MANTQPQPLDTAAMIQKVGQLLDQWSKQSLVPMGPHSQAMATPAVQGGPPPQLAQPLSVALPNMPVPGAQVPQGGGSTPRTPVAPPVNYGLEFGNPRSAKAAGIQTALAGIGQIADKLEQRKYDRERSQYEYMLRLYEQASQSNDPTMKQFAADLVNSKQFQKFAKDVAGYKPLPPEQVPPAVAALNSVVGTGAGAGANAPGGQAPQARPAYAGAPTQPGGMPTSIPSQAGPTPQGLQQAAQQMISQAPPELQGVLSSFWTAASQLPGGVQAGLKSMADMTAEYMVNQQKFGQQQALLNMREVFQGQIEQMRETNRIILENMREAYGERQLDARLQAMADMNQLRVDAMDRRTDAYLKGIADKLAATGNRMPIMLASRLTQAEIIKEQVSDLRVQLNNENLRKFMGPVVGQAGFVTRRFSPTVERFFVTQESLDALLSILHGYRGGAQTHHVFKQAMGSLDIKPEAYEATLKAVDELADNVINEISAEYPTARGKAAPQAAHETTTTDKVRDELVKQGLLPAPTEVKP